MADAPLPALAMLNRFSWLFGCLQMLVVTVVTVVCGLVMVSMGMLRFVESLVLLVLASIVIVLVVMVVLVNCVLRAWRFGRVMHRLLGCIRWELRAMLAVCLEVLGMKLVSGMLGICCGSSILLVSGTVLVLSY